MYIRYIHMVSRVAMTFVLVVSATNVNLAVGQDVRNCFCENAEVIEQKACQPSKNCSGDYSVTGCNPNTESNCSACTFTKATCCATHYLVYQNEGVCGALSKRIAALREDKDLMSGDIDLRRVFVPVCRGTYMSLDQVLNSNNAPEVSHAYIVEH
jgi:hypothetical protein